VHNCAQTNVQLFDQLRSDGYSKPEREYVRDVYAFVMRLFAGLYLPSGKPFIDHLVGTAGVLASLRVPVEVVAAGLIHAAYLHGDFGSVRTGISDSKREQVRRVVGDQAEEYIVRYDRLILTPEAVSSLYVDRLEPVDRYVLLMRLANELEHSLDLGGFYFVNSETEQRGHRRYTENWLRRLAPLANGLGFPSLAEDIENVLKEIAAVEIPVEPLVRCRHEVAFLVTPRSYRERFTVLCRRKFSEGRRSLLRALRRLMLLGGKIFRLMRRVAHAPERRT
jgi:(p)ppGpp synthase/HD superfamily hydrolase